MTRLGLGQAAQMHRLNLDFSVCKCILISYILLLYLMIEEDADRPVESDPVMA